MTFLGILSAIVGLGLLIIVHEAGHFFVARWCGMRVERFSIGFGPGILKWRSKKGTLFQLAPIPFGGFVEIRGMNIAEDVDPDDRAAYPNRPVWQRIATIFAGPGTNYLTAVVLAFGLYTCAGVPTATPRYTVGAVQADYPAAEVLKPGDRIIAANGVEVWRNGPQGQADDLGKVTNAGQGAPMQLTIERGGKRMDVTVNTKHDAEAKRYRMGIAFVSTERQTLGVARSAKEAVIYPFAQTQMILGGLYDAMTRDDVKMSASGPAGIGKEFVRAFESGWVDYLVLLIALNVYLGLFNLLPLPALDGGRLAFLAYELVTRRRPNPRVETTVHMVGILALIVLMVAVTWSDIVS